MVTLAVEESLPITEVGIRTRTVGTGVLAVSVAVCETPLYDAVMVGLASAATALVVTVKVALVFPAATVTVAGTVAATVLLLERATTSPPVGAAPVIVTVPVEGEPPVTLVGRSVRLVGTGAVIGSKTLCSVSRGST